MSEKIKPQHVARKAILYVRQSSAYQVQYNEESRRLQYAMAERLHQLGWQEVEVIDDDLGRSAAGTAVRSGFERMVAEVCLGKVGAVAAREVSRFARNSREWQQLMEVCRLVDTLLIDQDVIYAPRSSNDRLLLGLKGSMNEYELELLRQRSLEARYEKAKRGELIVSAPVGFLKTEDQRLEKDPDRRVQERIQLVFRKFQELGSVRQTMFWLVEENLQVPVRDQHGSLSWKRPRYGSLYSMLTHPAYGGAYVFGRTEAATSYAGGQLKKATRRRTRAEWHTLIPHHHEGYVTWEQFEEIQTMLSKNNFNAEQPGAAKRGSGLLSGLLRCRRCGRKLTVAYTGLKTSGLRFLRYCCVRGALDNGESKCISFGGVPVDTAVAREIFRVVEPAAVQEALTAEDRDVAQQDAVLTALQQDLEAARYAARRAEKQYDANDPENRLVSDELERRWNQALERVRELELRLEQEQQRRKETPVFRIEQFASLAEELRTAWNDPRTDIRLKKRIVRTLLHEVLVDTDNTVGEVVLTLHWQGGVHTELRVPRRKRGQATRTAPDVLAAVRSLARVANDEQIAGYLNRNGALTGRGNRWTRQRITSLRQYHEIPVFSPEAKAEAGWLILTEAARLLRCSSRTVRLAVERGELRGEHPLPDGPWLFQLTDLTSSALYARNNPTASNPAVPNSPQKTLAFSDK